MEISHAQNTAADEKLRYTLALNGAPGVGPKTFADLVKHFGDAESVFKSPLSGWQECRFNDALMHYLRNPDWAQVDRDLNWRSGNSRNHLVCLSDPAYPKLLREISDSPSVLYVHGDLGILSSLQLAVVGSRHPTPAGRQNAYDFAHFLAKSGLTITSGLALGIDGASHEGALAAAGLTIAVMGTGLDQIYPAKHQALAYQIADHGALVSEFPIGTSPLPQHFPRRNRLISALSLGCLVVEAALRSGSLITARHALEQGREVFAIPGSIHNPLAKGCHRLIREGAKLVETASDILVELGNLAHASWELLAEPNQTKARKSKHDITITHSTPSQQALNQEYQQVLAKMSHDPVSVDYLVEHTGLSAREVSSMMLILELQGYVSAAPGGTYLLHR